MIIQGHFINVAHLVRTENQTYEKLDTNSTVWRYTALPPPRVTTYALNLIFTSAGFATLEFRSEAERVQARIDIEKEYQRIHGTIPAFTYCSPEIAEIPLR